MKYFSQISENLIARVNEWEPQLLSLPEKALSEKYNAQNRNIKMILGHMVDSVSNNTHRVIHLQYQHSPCHFPDYANLGNNDKWISIQNYSNENWENLVKLWKYAHYHFAHVIKNMDESKLSNIWVSALKEEITLQNMVSDFPRHFALHMAEIETLIST